MKSYIVHLQRTPAKASDQARNGRWVGLSPGWEEGQLPNVISTFILWLSPIQGEFLSAFDWDAQNGVQSGTDEQ